VRQVHGRQREHRDVVFSGFEYAQAFGEIHRV
jgi:hypothetical protein